MRFQEFFKSVKTKKDLISTGKTFQLYTGITAKDLITRLAVSPMSDQVQQCHHEQQISADRPGTKEVLVK